MERKHSDTTVLNWLKQKYGGQELLPEQQDTEELPQFVPRDYFDVVVADLRGEIADLRRRLDLKSERV